jgi:hypothetical protein
MLAKSIRYVFQGLHVGNVRQSFRNVVFTMALIAVLTGLALIMRDQYGDFFEGQALAKILPFELFRPGAAEASPEPDAQPIPRARVDPNDGRYRVLAEFVAKRYRVSRDVTFDLVMFAHTAGHKLGLDPLLIIAVIAVESRFNPIAESGAGAKGLMQVIPEYHREKLEEFGGEHAVFDPQINILVGSKILKEYLRRTGNLSIALQMYAGALNDGEDAYTVKVMNEKQRLQHTVNQSKRKTVRVAQGSPLAQ